MPPLPTEFRNLLERTVIAARDEFEKAARAALVRLAAHLPQPYASLTVDDRNLRNRLRAEGECAVFAVALAAWKVSGYRELPLPNIACSGLLVGANAYEVTHLADGDPDMEAMLRRLHRVFHNAPDLGSLIDPMRIAQEEGIFAIEWAKWGRCLKKRWLKIAQTIRQPRSLA